MSLPPHSLSLNAPLRAQGTQREDQFTRDSHGKPSAARTHARCTFNRPRSQPVRHRAARATRDFHHQKTMARRAHRARVLVGPCRCQALVLQPVPLGGRIRQALLEHRRVLRSHGTAWPEIHLQPGGGRKGQPHHTRGGASWKSARQQASIASRDSGQDADLPTGMSAVQCVDALRKWAELREA